jgi:CheY-like chemotaxis protein
MALHADEKGLELICDLAPGIPEWVQGDSGRLRQIILNLVGNASKFTHHGEITLRAESEKQESGSNAVHFTVSDTGIGIPRDAQQSIFDPFTQADSSTTRNYGGTGLGLTISARLVSLMGGTIWIESEAGRGSHFHFTVQLRDSKQSHETKDALPSEILYNLRILVVDDNQTNRKVLQGILNRWEVQTTCVESGLQALSELGSGHASGKPYQLVLTDMHMPVMDGFALAEEIRRRPELSATAVLMLTSAGHRGDAERCRDLGIAAYLYKPVRKQELLSSLLAAIGRLDQLPQSAIVALHVPAVSCHILVVEDNRVNQAVAIGMLQKLGHSHAIANSGLEALSLLATQSFDLVLMDVQMPEMDGFTATRKIRDEEGQTQPRLPIIAMTAHAMKGDRERCLAAGMDDYISKPINARGLERAIARVLSQREDPSIDDGPKSEEQRATPNQAGTWDIRKSLERLGGDEKLLTEIVEIFLEEGPKQMTNLQHAIAEGNAEGIE